MLIWYVFLVVMLFLLVVFVVSQIIIPLWCDRPLFPLFRKSEASKVIEQIQEVNEAADVEVLKTELAEKVELVDSIKKYRETKTSLFNK